MNILVATFYISISDDLIGFTLYILFVGSLETDINEMFVIYTEIRTSNSVTALLPPWA